jgi:membrane protein DedA with SNARE-associated domain
MPFSGYLVSNGRFDLFWVATAGAVGCNIGSTLAYYVGVYGGRRAIGRWGRYLLIDPKDLDLADRFFHKYGAATVFVSRLLPVVRTFIALPAGIAHMNPLKFQAYTFLGSWPWCFTLAYIGMKLGEAWNSDPTLKDALHRFDAVIVTALLAGAAWYVWRHVRGARRS